MSKDTYDPKEIETILTKYSEAEEDFLKTHNWIKGTLDESKTTLTEELEPQNDESRHYRVGSQTGDL